jgi:hypothetical protein
MTEQTPTPVTETRLPAAASRTKVTVNGVKRHLDRFILSAGYSGLVVVLTLMAGLIASGYSTSILESFPFYWGVGTISPSAIAFWATAVGAALLYHRRQRLIDRERSKTIRGFLEKAAELQDTSSQLARLVRTMPPPDFLSTYDTVYTKAADLTSSTLSREGLEKEEIGKAIRALLGAIATLAHVFDGRPDDCVYGVNLMTFRRTRALSGEEAEALTARLLFCEPGTDVRQLEGVLELDTSLSTATDAKDSEPDPNLKPIVLPIPLAENRIGENGKQKYLPGAPAVFITGLSEKRAFEGYADTQTLGQWCSDHCEFSPTVVRRFEQYFCKEMSAHIRSFASLSMAPPGEPSPTAVLNIHRDTPGVLRDREAQEHFVLMISSVTSLLLQLLDRLRV